MLFPSLYQLDHKAMAKSLLTEETWYPVLITWMGMDSSRMLMLSFSEFRILMKLEALKSTNCTHSKAIYNFGTTVFWLTPFIINLSWFRVREPTLVSPLIQYFRSHCLYVFIRKVFKPLGIIKVFMRFCFFLGKMSVNLRLELC